MTNKNKNKSKNHNDQNINNVNNHTHYTQENNTHSPLFEKIIAARESAGYADPEPCTLTPSELEAVKKLRTSETGAVITIGSGDDEEVFVKG